MRAGAVIAACVALACAAGFVIWKKAIHPEVANREKTADVTAHAAGLPLPAEAWRDALADLKILGPGDTPERTADGLVLKKGTSGILNGTGRRNGAIRIQAVRSGGNDLVIQVRNGGGNGSYQLGLARDQQAAISRTKSGVRLKDFPLPNPIQPGETYSMELRIEGSTLTAFVNGVRLGSVEDSTLPEGDFRVGQNTHQSILIRSLEFLPLPDDRSAPAPTPSESTPATATQEDPFENTLGMKFVPVPITGGPTGGQRVLFSVWETRVQDFELFAKETNLSWKARPKFDEPAQPADGVSWEEATVFGAWLTERERKTGKLAATEIYRLPTDHEWSCAVGIGAQEDPSQTPEAKNGKLADIFPWGTTWPPPENAGNYAGEEMEAAVAAKTHPYLTTVMKGYRDPFTVTAPVGRFSANEFGLFDLGGNLQELCQDSFGADPESVVARGAEFKSAEKRRLLSSHRGVFPRTHHQTGFRVVLAPVLAVQTTTGARPEEKWVDALAEWRQGKLPEGVAAGLPPSAEVWRDAFADLTFMGLRGKPERNAEGLVLKKATAGIIAGTGRRNGAVRIQAVRKGTGFDVGIQVRKTGGNRGTYNLRLSPDQQAEFTRKPAPPAGVTRLEKLFPLPNPIQPGETYSMELRIVGSTLTASVNGVLLGSVVDSTFPEGEFSVGEHNDDVLIHTLEFLSLPDDRPASPAPAEQSSPALQRVETSATPGSADGLKPSTTFATATKDAPFVNTLGMKFVPVPITGGPTGGQRGSSQGTGQPLVPGAATSVLFSIWETRVQDYEVFATEARQRLPQQEFPQGPTHPVLTVSWDDAQAFCKWLTERERKAGKLGATESYRLPTDHEWSCAVGIGDREDPAQTPEEKGGKVADVYPWGTDSRPPAGAGNYSGQEVAGEERWQGQGMLRGYRDDFPATAPVGSFTPTPLGLFDLGGNAREWCEDWNDEKQEGRVMRGAAFDMASFLLSSSRSAVLPSSRLHRSGGFRVVLSAAQ